MKDKEWMYCVDCHCCTDQKYHGVHGDGFLYYICEVCGCENDFVEDDTER